MSSKAVQDAVMAKHDIYKCHVLTLIPGIFNRCDYTIVRLFNDYKPVRKIPKKDGWTFNYKTDTENVKERKEEIESIEGKLQKFNEEYRKNYQSKASKLEETVEKQVEENVENNVEENVENNVENNVEETLENKVEENVEENVENKVENKVENQQSKKTESKLESKVEKVQQSTVDENWKKRESELEKLLREKDQKIEELLRSKKYKKEVSSQLASNSKSRSNSSHSEYLSSNSSRSNSSRSDSSRSPSYKSRSPEIAPPPKKTNKFEYDNTKNTKISPYQKKQGRYNVREESSVISTISPVKTNLKKKMDSIISPPKRHHKMKHVLDNFNEEDEEDEEEENEDEEEERPPSPKYKTKNNKKLEFYKLLQKISSSVKTYSGTTQSESDSGTESDSSNRSNSRSHFSSDSSDGYPSPKPIKKTQANQRPLKR
jgi:hypothetical protein